MTVRVIGIDPSLTSTGIALHDGSTRTIRPQAGPSDNARRLNQIITRIDIYLKADKPDLVVIEKVFVGALSKNTVLLLGGLAWCLRQRLFEMGISYADVDNQKLKQYATGSGSASKDDMLSAARQSGVAAANDDEADAFFLHAMGRSQFSETWEPAYRCVELLDVRAKVRASIKWPALEMSHG